LAIIARPKLIGVGEHWGVLLPDGRVAHCTPERGEHICSLHEFAAGYQLSIKRDLPVAQQGQAMRTLWEVLRAPKPYHPTDNNCEIFANRIAGEKPESPTLNSLIFVAVVALALRLAAGLS
jgi:hypothetical protein